MSVSECQPAAYNPAECRAHSPAIGAHKKVRSAICSTAVSGLSTKTPNYVRDSKASANFEFSRRRSSERRKPRRSSGKRSKDLRRLCADRLHADALAASRALAELGAISTAPSCRNPKSSKRADRSTNATQQGAERERRKRNAQLMALFFESRAPNEPKNKAQVPRCVEGRYDRRDRDNSSCWVTILERPRIDCPVASRSSISFFGATRVS